MKIIKQTYGLLKEYYAERWDSLVVEQVQIGTFLTAVKLSNGHCGIATTDIEILSNCYCHKRDYGIFSAGNIKGHRIVDILQHNEKPEIFSSLKLAVLNAISAEKITSGNYKIIESTDPFDLLDLSQPKTISIIGAFQSYIKKLAGTKHKLHVIELHEQALLEDQKQFFIPAEKTEKTLLTSDIIIITGMTLVNKTLDNILSFIPDNRQVIVVGPSGGLIPDILFKNKVKIIGSMLITDAAKMFDIVAEAGSAYHLYKSCAKKICIINDAC